MRTRPVEFILNNLEDLQKVGRTDKDIYKAFLTEEFQEKFKKEYPDQWTKPNEEFAKMYREIDYYNKFMKETELECINGNDGDLEYVYQCQECGTIIINDHSSDVCIDYDILCPTCNDTEDKTPFKFFKYKTKDWVHNMRWAEVIHGELEEGDDFMAGSVANCKFRTTRYMIWSIKRDYYLGKIKGFFRKEK